MHALSDQDLIKTLLAVGADRDITVTDFDRTFEDLDLDSLARAEFAAKVKDGSGVDVEQRVTQTATPNQIRRLLMADHSTPIGM